MGNLPCPRAGVDDASGQRRAQLLDAGEQHAADPERRRGLDVGGTVVDEGDVLGAARRARAARARRSPGSGFTIPSRALTKIRSNGRVHSTCSNASACAWGALDNRASRTPDRRCSSTISRTACVHPRPAAEVHRVQTDSLGVGHCSSGDSAPVGSRRQTGVEVSTVHPVPLAQLVRRQVEQARDLVLHVLVVRQRDHLAVVQQQPGSHPVTLAGVHGTPCRARSK